MAFQAFQPFDTDGNGTAEVVTMLDAVTTYTGPNTMGELGKNIRMLQACSLLPGFVDVYAGDTNPISQHGEKILKVKDECSCLLHLLNWTNEGNP